MCRTLANYFDRRKHKKWGGFHQGDTGGQQDTRQNLVLCRHENHQGYDAENAADQHGAPGTRQPSFEKARRHAEQAWRRLDRLIGAESMERVPEEPLGALTRTVQAPGARTRCEGLRQIAKKTNTLRLKAEIAAFVCFCQDPWSPR